MHRESETIILRCIIFPYSQILSFIYFVIQSAIIFVTENISVFF